jgi:hypothetical protein
MMMKMTVIRILPMKRRRGSREEVTDGRDEADVLFRWLCHIGHV